MAPRMSATLVRRFHFTVTFAQHRNITVKRSTIWLPRRRRGSDVMCRPFPRRRFGKFRLGQRNNPMGDQRMRRPLRFLRLPRAFSNASFVPPWKVSPRVLGRHARARPVGIRRQVHQSGKGSKVVNSKGRPSTAWSRHHNRTNNQAVDQVGNRTEHRQHARYFQETDYEVTDGITNFLNRWRVRHHKRHCCTYSVIEIFPIIAYTPRCATSEHE